MNLSAQSEKCASDAIHNYMLVNDAAYNAKNTAFEAQLVSNKLQPNKTTVIPIYKVPVVVHVMHKGEALGTGTNISDALIKQGIKALNERYRKAAGSLGDGNGVDVEIEFALAVRDSTGNCTNGITRNDMSANATYMQYGVRRSGANGITDAQLKAVMSWTKLSYYNIWLISEIDDNNGGSGTQGYAFFASSHGSISDGTVVLNNSFSNRAKITTAHELGHALNLFHTFEGDVSGTACPVGNACGSGAGDCCGDTPPHKRTAVSTCTDVANSCDGGSSSDLYLHNYLDYSSDACQNEFTTDQKTRMVASLTILRSSYLESNGNMSLVPVVVADINFAANSSIICTGQSVDFTDESSCSPNTFLNTTWSAISFSWTFTNNAGTTYTSTLQNPTMAFATAGTYDVTLSITNVVGTSSYTKQGMVVVSSSPMAATCTGTSSSISTLTYGIYNVRLNGMSHASSSTYNDIQSALTNATGYGDFSCSAGTILEPSTTYTLEIKGSSSTSLIEDFKAFIDYNNDGDFGDVGEEIAFWNDRTGSSSYLDTTFTTPAVPSLNVPLRMRVFSGRSTETITSCGTTTRGQIHDYSVRISGKIAKVSITANPSGTINYGDNVTFTALPVNGGTSPVYQWYLNGNIISGENGASFSNTTLSNTDQIYCVLISNLAEVIASPSNSNVLTLSVIGAVGLAETKNQIQYTIMPNPSNGQIELLINSQNKTLLKMDVVNTLGQVVYSNLYKINTTESKHNIDLSSIGKGAFFIRVYDGNQFVIKKLIIN